MAFLIGLIGFLGTPDWMQVYLASLNGFMDFTWLILATVFSFVLYGTSGGHGQSTLFYCPQAQIASGLPRYWWGPMTFMDVHAYGAPSVCTQWAFNGSAGVARVCVSPPLPSLLYRSG